MENSKPKYHYFITVIYGNNLAGNLENLGKLQLDCYLEVTDKEIEDCELTDQAYKMQLPLQEMNFNMCTEIYKTSNIFFSLSAMKLRSKIHNGIVCHLTSDFKISREEMEIYIQNCDITKLKQSSIR